MVKILKVMAVALAAPGGTSNYNKLFNKPSLNGTELVGDVAVVQSISVNDVEQEIDENGHVSLTGMFSMDTRVGSNAVYATVGSRLMFIPQ